MLMQYKTNPANGENMHMREPLISIVIPVYNTQEYIIACLESITKQTYKNYEVIIVNDGSTDKSEEVISSFIEANKLEKFHLLNKENGGVSSARNLGLARAKGEWVTFVDSDDWIEPGFLENAMIADDQYHADLYFTGAADPAPSGKYLFNDRSIL